MTIVSNHNFEQIIKNNDENNYLKFESYESLYCKTEIEKIEFSTSFTSLFHYNFSTSDSEESEISKIYYNKLNDKISIQNNSKTANTKIISCLSPENINSNILKKKKSRGRKTKDSEERGIHNKESFDNMTRKIKVIVLKSFLDYFNNKIKDIYKDSESKSSWKLEKLNQSQVSKANLEYNRIFFKKTLKEIFSDTITSKWKKKDTNHNKMIINNLLNEEDETKRKIFEKNLNSTFLDLLKYLRGEKEGLEYFEGLEFDEFMLSNITKDENYYKKFIYTMNNIEKLIYEKKSRKRKNINK
jgi:hypothetical protein